MNDTQKQTPKIDWFKSYGNLALGVWGIATYLALLGGIAWLATSTGSQSPKAAAVMAVLYSTCVHWMTFALIEHKSNK